MTARQQPHRTAPPARRTRASGTVTGTSGQQTSSAAKTSVWASCQLPFQVSYSVFIVLYCLIGYWLDCNFVGDVWIGWIWHCAIHDCFIISMTESMGRVIFSEVGGFRVATVTSLR